MTMLDARSELKRIRIRRRDTGEEMEVHFNPASLVVAHAARWNEPTASTAADVPLPEYIRALPRQLELNLVFDGVEGERDVVGDIACLASWMKPSERSRSEGHAQPPILEVDWNEPSKFDCYLQAVQATYKLFDRDGTPLRADVKLTLKEVPADPPGTNPTSGGERGHKRHVVTAGETLHSVASRELGDPRLWRGLALINGIDDPLRLRPGAVLHVPPRDAAAEHA